VIHSSRTASATSSSLHYSPVPTWGPSHGRQSTKFSSVSPSHGLQFFVTVPVWALFMCPFYRLQSFRNELLQHGSPVGSQVLPANLLQRGAWAPVFTGPQVLPKACSSAESPYGHSLPWPSTCSSIVLQNLTMQVSICFLLLTSMGCMGTACLTMVFTTGCGGISAPAPGAPLPHPSSLTLVSAGLFHTFSLFSSGCCHFPLLQFDITEMLSASLVSSDFTSGGSILEPAGIGSIRLKGGF